jgi:hypothetical protein
MKPQFFLLASALTLGASALSLPVQAKHTVANPVYLAQSLTPEQTYMTPQNSNEIAIQITDGEFYFYDILHRTYGNYFTAANSGVRVTYNRYSGNVLVINSVTGAEFYNYTFSEAAAGSGSDRPTGNPVYGAGDPVTTITPLNVDQFDARIVEGEFVFDGVLDRVSDTVFIGSDRQVRVVYDLAAERIVIINAITGTEFYNYVYDAPSEGYL